MISFIQIATVMKTYTGSSGGTYTKTEDVDAALKDMKVTPDIFTIRFIAAAVKRKIGIFSSKSEVSFTDPVLGYAYWYFIDNFTIHGVLGNAYVFPGLGAPDEAVDKSPLDILKENATAKMVVFDTILKSSEGGIQASSSIRAHFFQAVADAPP
jgi:hypothetical protein